jgi:hypothetical protein
MGELVPVGLLLIDLTRGSEDQEADLSVRQINNGTPNSGLSSDDGGPLLCS